jgi:tetratricopeptide (TPR) repeat protein
MLFDFNLAFAQQLAGGSIVGGTLPYMAPEQLRQVAARSAEGPDDEINAQVDVFSFGVTLYELLCGKLPFGRIPSHLSKQGIAEELLERQRRGPRPLREVNERVEKSLGRIVESCLAFDPERRPRSAEDLAKALREELSVKRRARRWVRGHRRLAITLVLLWIAALGGLVSFWLTRQPYPARQFRLGWEAMEAGDYGRAASRFSNAWESDPSFIEALLYRGLAHMLNDGFKEANEDFLRVNTHLPEPDGRVTACMAHCVASRAHRNKDHMGWQDAVPLYQEAFDGGFRSSAVLYNIAFCYYKMGKLDRAEEALQESIQRDALHQASLHLLVIVDRKKALNEQRLPNIGYVQDAVDRSCGNPELMLDAACSYAVAASVKHQTDPASTKDYIVRALQCCEAAVRDGLDPSRLSKASSFYNPLEQEPRFQKLSNSARRKVEPIRTVWLVDPLAGLDEPLTLQRH